MSSEERIEALKMKHQTLEIELKNENQRPLPDSSVINKLKREKLRLKDEMARLSAH